MAFEPKRISELTVISTIASADIIPIVDIDDTAAGTSKIATVSAITNAVVSIGNLTTQGNTFNGANQLVQLNGSTQLPAVSGALLTNLNASSIGSGTIADARLSTNVTVQGNTFNGASQLVRLDSSTQLPAVSGVNLTNLNASNLGSGTIPTARYGTTVTQQGNTFNGASQLVQLNGSTQLPAVSGVNLTNLNASNLASGTVADARLSTNVQLKIKTITTVSTAGNTPIGSVNADTWFRTTHSTGVVTFTLQDSPTNTPGTHFRLFTDSTGQVDIITGSSTIIYYFGGQVLGGSSFSPAPQRGRVIDLYCVAANVFFMSGDIV